MTPKEHLCDFYMTKQLLFCDILLRVALRLRKAKRHAKGLRESGCVRHEPNFQEKVHDHQL